MTSKNGKQLDTRLVGSRPGKKIKAEASTFALISSMMATVVAPSIVTPPDFTKIEETDIAVSASFCCSLFGLANIFALVSSIGALGASAFIMAQINLLCTNADIRDWIIKYSWLTAVYVVLFTLSVVSFTIGAWCSFVLTSNTWAIWVVTAFVGAVLFVVAVGFNFIFHGFILPRLYRQK